MTLKKLCPATEELLRTFAPNLGMSGEQLACAVLKAFIDDLFRDHLNAVEPRRLAVLQLRLALRVDEATAIAILKP